MKCIRCSYDSKANERTNRICPACNKPFAFDRGDLVTDAGFKAAIDAVSADGALRWGVENLYYELNRRRRWRVPPLGCLVPLTPLLLLSAAAGWSGKRGWWVMTLLILAVMLWALRALITKRPLFASSTVRLSLQAFNPLWERFVATHGVPEGAIVRKPQLERRRAVEPDLADYSFDRAVICDRARTVDLLLANNFHFENNCAVLSIGGYPSRAFETVRAMLRRNPRLQVFALHDATGPGCAMPYRLAHEHDWFRGTTVVDVGLRPGHAPPLVGLWIPAPGKLKPGIAISPSEASWLSQHYLELAAIRPEQVLKRLYRAINRMPEPARRNDDDTHADVEVDADSFGSDASAADGGADGFG